MTNQYHHDFYRNSTFPVVVYELCEESLTIKPIKIEEYGLATPDCTQESILYYAEGKRCRSSVEHFFLTRNDAEEALERLRMSLTTKPKLEELAYAQATAQYLSELGSADNWFMAYEYLIECVEKGEEPDLTAWQPFEHWEWKDIADRIDDEAQSILSLLKQVLKLAKEGIVYSAINDTLTMDMNQLCMQNMVELGACQEVSNEAE